MSSLYACIIYILYLYMFTFIYVCFRPGKLPCTYTWLYLWTLKIKIWLLLAVITRLPGHGGFSNGQNHNQPRFSKPVALNPHPLADLDTPTSIRWAFKKQSKILVDRTLIKNGAPMAYKYVVILSMEPSAKTTLKQTAYGWSFAYWSSAYRSSSCSV